MKNDEPISLSDIQNLYTERFEDAVELAKYVNEHNISKEQIVSICYLEEPGRRFQLFYYA